MTAWRGLPRMPSMRLQPHAVRRLLWGAALALCAGSALPQTPTLYTVEIVVFRNGSDIGALPVTEPQAAPDQPVAAPAASASPQPPDATATTPATAPAALATVDATPVANTKLNSAAAKLTSKAGLKVLAHVAWTQMPTAWNSRIGVSAEQLGLGNGISGKIFLERGQFLHLGLDLTVDTDGHRFRIDEVRKLKPNEIHYFDRPALGVLAIVTGSASG